jgi:glycerol uptake facilitator-like aquaporin
VFVAHMIALPITGCSINPTRSFASAAAASSVSSCTPWKNHWVFWFAPLLGGALAGFVYDYSFHAGGGKVDRLIDQYILRK